VQRLHPRGLAAKADELPLRLARCGHRQGSSAAPAAAGLELALAALEELEYGITPSTASWQMRLERARYEAALAERRYQEVDSVAAAGCSHIGRRWNDALVDCEELKQQCRGVSAPTARVATQSRKQKCSPWLKICRKLWHAPTTQAKDRKRFAPAHQGYYRPKSLCYQRSFWFRFRWQGMPVRPHSPAPAERSGIACAILPPVVDRVRELARHLTGRRDR